MRCTAFFVCNDAVDGMFFNQTCHQAVAHRIERGLLSNGMRVA